MVCNYLTSPRNRFQMTNLQLSSLFFLRIMDLFENLITPKAISPEKHTKKVSVCESFQGGLAPLLSVDNVRREEMGGEGAGGQTGKDPPLLRMVPSGPVLCTQTCVLDSRGPFQQGTWNSLAKFCSFDSLPKHN